MSKSLKHPCRVAQGYSIHGSISLGACATQIHVKALHHLRLTNKPSVLRIEPVHMKQQPLKGRHRPSQSPSELHQAGQSSRCSFGHRLREGPERSRKTPLQQSGSHIKVDGDIAGDEADLGFQWSKVRVRASEEIKNQNYRRRKSESEHQVVLLVLEFDDGLDCFSMELCSTCQEY